MLDVVKSQGAPLDVALMFATPPAFPVKITNKELEKLEGRLLDLPQVDCPLTHAFAPGVYVRTIFMPAGTFIIGQEHKTRHFNVVLAGRAKVMTDGIVRDVVAPCIFESGIGVRKVLYIIEDMHWATIHPTRETNIEKLERKLVKKSRTFRKYFADMQKLKQLVDQQQGGKSCLS